MPYEKLEVAGSKSEIYSWMNHPISSDETNMLRNMSRLPCLFKHISVMADGHLGKGAMVGSVVALKDSVVPSMVGVDIGCGMNAVLTPFTADQITGDKDLKSLRLQIEEKIPVGFNKNATASAEAHAWAGFDTFEDLHKGVQDRKKNALQQLGTLGGGNHFIEICLDTEDRVWLVLHSGSRNIGKELAERHIATAKTLHKLSELPDPDLAYFVKGTDEFKNYWKDLQWAQEYAFVNRQIMMKRLIKIVSKRYNKDKIFRPLMDVNCHHNYASEETHFDEQVIITRKGAVNAGESVLGIIPGSMGAKSYIVRGLGNPDSYNSCSHGAGRRMSRGQAKRAFTLDDMKAQTKGVECRKDNGVLDEIPKAYKNIEEVMRNQADLVEIVAEVKQVLCVKG
jgi:tRNA-splicing ligase RtcB